jgi:hypothetical protein
MHIHDSKIVDADVGDSIRKKYNTKNKFAEVSRSALNFGEDCLTMIEWTLVKSFGSESSNHFSPAPDSTLALS